MKFYLLSNNLGNKSKIEDLFIIEENQEYIMIANRGKIINIFSKEKIQELSILNQYFQTDIELFEFYFSLDLDKIKKSINNSLILENNKVYSGDTSEIKDKILKIFERIE